MKFTIVSFYETFPPESGAANVSYHLAKFLPGEKYLIQISHGPKRKKGSHQINSQIKLINIYVHSKNRIKKFFKLFLSFFALSKKIKEINPDVVIMEGASWTFYYLILAKVLRLLNIDKKLVYHSHNVEYVLRKEKNSWFVVQITRFSEKWLMNHSDLSTAVSRKDKDLFKKLYGAEPILLPNGVNTKNFNEIENEEIRRIKKKYKIEGKVVLFMGLAGYKPTEEALEFLIHKVFPIILTQHKNVKLAVLGGKIHFKGEFIINPGMISYKEVPVVIKACDIGVAPIFSGSGTRLKILEYMAAGKPVVSTSKGAEGLDVVPKKDIIIADDEDDFAEATIDLLGYPEKARSMGMNGKKLVESDYSWEKITEDFLFSIKELFPQFIKNGDQKKETAALVSEARNDKRYP